MLRGIGVLEEVPANEPTVWLHRMVVVRKQNSSPCRVVDMQRLNYAWEGHYSVPLDKESSRLTSFITQFGCYRYLANPLGNHVSGDAYNIRFNIVTAHVQDVQRQV